MEQICRQLNLQSYILPLKQNFIEIGHFEALNAANPTSFTITNMDKAQENKLIKKCGLDFDSLTKIRIAVDKRQKQRVMLGQQDYTSQPSSFAPQFPTQTKVGNKRTQALLGNQNQQLQQKQAIKPFEIPPTREPPTTSVQMSSLPLTTGAEQIPQQPVMPKQDDNRQRAGPSKETLLSALPVKSFLEDSRSTNATPEDPIRTTEKAVTLPLSLPQTTVVPIQVHQSPQPKPTTNFAAPVTQPRQEVLPKTQAPLFKSPPSKEVLRKTHFVPLYEPYQQEKCNPLQSQINFDYVNDKLVKHRQGIIDKYGSSKVPTPCMSVLSKSSPTHNRFDSASKADLQKEINDYIRSEKKEVEVEVKLNFDDELSQVVKPETSHPKQVHVVDTKNQTSGQDQKQQHSQVFSSTTILSLCSVPIKTLPEPNSDNVFQGKILTQTQAAQPQCDQVPDIQMESENDHQGSEDDYDGTYAPKQEMTDEEDPYIIESPPNESQPKLTDSTSGIQNSNTGQNVPKPEEDITLIEYANQRENTINQTNEEDVQFMHRRGSSHKQLLWQTGRQLSNSNSKDSSSSRSDEEMLIEERPCEVLNNKEIQQVKQVELQENTIPRFEIEVSDQSMTSEDDISETYERTLPFNSGLSDEEESSELEIESAPEILQQPKESLKDVQSISQQIVLPLEPLVALKTYMSIGVHVYPNMDTRQTQWSPQLSPKMESKETAKLQTPEKVQQQIVCQPQAKKTGFFASATELIGQFVFGKPDPKEHVEIAKFVSMPVVEQAITPVQPVKPISTTDEFRSPTAKFVMSTMNGRPTSLRQKALIQSPTPRTQDTDKERSSARDLTNQNSASPHTKQLLKLNSQPKTTSTFTAQDDETTQRPVRKVRFEDQNLMNEEEIETEMIREENRSLERVNTRKVQEASRKQRMQERQKAREARKEQDVPIPRRQETHPHKRQETRVQALAPVNNKHTRTQRKEYAKFEESEEEVREPVYKRQKIQQPETPAIVTESPTQDLNHPSLQMTDEAAERFKLMKKRLGL